MLGLCRPVDNPCERIGPALNTVGTHWAEWIDMLPIVAFALLYAWLILTVLLAWPAPRKRASEFAQSSNSG